MKQGHADAAPVTTDLTQCGKVDLEEHGNDHQPDQHSHRQVDAGDLSRAYRLEHTRHKMAKRDAYNDAQCNPEGEIAFKGGHAIPSDRCDAPAVFIDHALAFLLDEFAALRRQ